MTEQLRTSIKCSVCLGTYKDPRMFSCGHSFCLECIRGIATQKYVPPCPKCRKPHKDFTIPEGVPQNVDLRQLVEELEKLPLSPMGVLPVDHSCNCQTCEKSHTVRDVLYCRDHATFACLRCILSSHKHCNYIDATQHGLNEVTQTVLELTPIKNRFQELRQGPFAEVKTSLDIIQRLQSNLASACTGINERFTHNEARITSLETVLKEAEDDEEAAAVLAASGHLLQQRETISQLFESQQSMTGELIHIVMDAVDQLQNGIIKKGVVSKKQDVSVYESTFDDEHACLFQHIASCLDDVHSLRSVLVHTFSAAWKKRGSNYAWYCVSLVNGGYSVSGNGFPYVHARLSSGTQLTLFSTDQVTATDQSTLPRLYHFVEGRLCEIRPRCATADELQRCVEKEFGGKWVVALGKSGDVHVTGSAAVGLQVTVPDRDLDYLLFKVE